MNDDGPAGQRGRRDIRVSALCERYLVHFAEAVVIAVPACSGSGLGMKCSSARKLYFFFTQPMLFTRKCLPFFFVRDVSRLTRPLNEPVGNSWAISGTAMSSSWPYGFLALRSVPTATTEMPPAATTVVG